MASSKAKCSLPRHKSIGETSGYRYELWEEIREAEIYKEDAGEIGCTVWRKGNEPHDRTQMNIR